MNEGLDEGDWNRHEQTRGGPTSREYGPILDEALKLIKTRFSELHGIDVQEKGTKAVVTVAFSGIPDADDPDGTEAGFGAVASDPADIVDHMIAAAFAVADSLGVPFGKVIMDVLQQFGDGKVIIGKSTGGDVEEDIRNLLSDLPDDEIGGSGGGRRPNINW